MGVRTSKEEGDRIARMVLQLVKAIRDDVKPPRPDELDRNGPSPTYAEFERLTGAA